MTSMLWQIMRALSPLSLDHDFRHLHLFAHPDDQLSASDGYLLHTLCLSLMRAAATTSSTWSPFCAAFPDGHATVSVVFPVMKKLEMERTLQNVLTSFCELRVDSTADHEFGSGFTMENALLCGLTAALVRDGWTVFEGNLAVHGVITEWLAGTPTEAVAFVCVLYEGSSFTDKKQLSFHLQMCTTLFGRLSTLGQTIASIFSCRQMLFGFALSRCGRSLPHICCWYSKRRWDTSLTWLINVLLRPWHVFLLRLEGS